MSEDQQNDSRGIRVFVYGTLKQGHPNHRLLNHEGATFLGRSYIKGSLTMLSLGGFPAVVATDKHGDSNCVYGEVYRVNNETLDALDMLEGHPNFYTRSQINTPWKKAWCYYLPESYLSRLERVESGAWKPTEDEQRYITDQENKKAS